MKKILLTFVALVAMSMSVCAQKVETLARWTRQELC